MNAYYCECGWPAYSAIAFSIKCPKCGSTITNESSQVSNQSKRLEELHRQGRELWAEIHSYNPPTWIPSEVAIWFDAWQRRIPSIGCACKKHWGEVVKNIPPDFSSREAFFECTVKWHNAINVHLSKQVVTLKQAIALWNAHT